MAILLLSAAQIFIRFHSSLIHDAAWYIDVAQGLLGGKKLYVDFIEVNPPLGMWLTVPPAWAAELLGVAPVPVFYTWLFMLTAACILLCWRYLRLAQVQGQKWHLLAIAGVLLFMPSANFGQREQFMVLFFLPWVLLRQVPANAAPAWERCLIGMLAALGIALKPHAIFAPLLVESLLYFHRRNLRGVFAAENITAITAAIAYVFAIAIFTPEYFTIILPLAKAAYFSYYGLPLSSLLVNLKWVVIFTVLAALCATDLRARLYLAAAAGFIISYVLQDKGYSYHILPATCFATLAFASGLIVWTGPARTRSLLQLLGAAAAAAFLITEPQAYAKNWQVEDAVDDARLQNAHSIFIASNRFSQAFPFVVERNLRWASRLPTQWLVPYVTAHWENGQPVDDTIVKQALDWTMEDLQTLKPDVVVVDDTPEQQAAMGGSFRFLDFWKQDSRFAAIWQDYNQIADADGLLIFQRMQR